MKQPILSRPGRVLAASRTLLATSRGGTEPDRSTGGYYAERKAYDTANSAVAPHRSVSVDVPYGGTITVTPEGKGTYTPA